MNFSHSTAGCAISIPGFAIDSFRNSTNVEPGETAFFSKLPNKPFDNGNDPEGAIVSTSILSMENGP